MTTARLNDPLSEFSSDQLDSLAVVIDLVRRHGGITRPDLVRRTGLGRALIAQRVAELLDLGVVEEADVAASTGGRPARAIRLRSHTGRFLVAELGATSVSVALTDIGCQTRLELEEPMEVSEGPESCLGQVERLFDDLLARDPEPAAPLWGIGLGVPGPVEFATGRPIAPPIMPGWDDYPVRERLVRRYGVPVWVDNEVNVMALGELRAGLAAGERHVIYVKIGTGIGAGLISNGTLHRGAQGCAGDLGHIAVIDDDSVLCRCGNRGCLEAVAGGAALGRDGALAAQQGTSPFLSDVLAQTGTVTARDVGAGTQAGDRASHDLLVRAGNVIGETLASMVNFFNPSLILLGGGVAESGDILMAAIREATYRRALPLATRELRLTRALLGKHSGLVGAAYMVSDEIFSRSLLPAWIASGTPAGITQAA
ncbi:MAG: ROK family transcriptional regulator [Streptosporangiaceae bacterium]